MRGFSYVRASASARQFICAIGFAGPFGHSRAGGSAAAAVRNCDMAAASYRPVLSRRCPSSRGPQRSRNESFRVLAFEDAALRNRPIVLVSVVRLMAQC